MTASLGERLLAARAKKQAAEEMEFEVFDGLFARHRPLEYRPTYRIVEKHENIKDHAERDLRVALDTIVATCVGCEARLDGEIQELAPLGLALNEAIGLDGAENDRQAVLELFGSEMAAMNYGTRLVDTE